jgi:hypothetical protein
MLINQEVELEPVTATALTNDSYCVSNHDNRNSKSGTLNSGHPETFSGQASISISDFGTVIQAWQEPSSGGEPGSLT